MKSVNATIERFKKQKCINEKVTECHKRNNPKTLKFYLQLKIHKEVNPGCPEVSSVNCHTANISKCEITTFNPKLRKYFIHQRNTRFS